MRFKTGTKVKHGDYGVGTVIIHRDDDVVGVDFGRNFRGHRLDGAITTDTGYWCSPDKLTIINQDVRELFKAESKSWV